MKHFFSILSILSIALTILSLADAMSAHRRDDAPGLVGAPSNVAGDELPAGLFDFVLAEINKQLVGQDEPLRIYSSFAHATKQVVSGIKYTFELTTMKSSNCKAGEELAADVVCELDTSALPVVYRVQVVHAAWRDPPFTLLSATTIDNTPSSPVSPPPPPPVDNETVIPPPTPADDSNNNNSDPVDELDDATILASVADFVVESLNARTNTMYRSVLDHVSSYSRQLVAGWKYDIRLVVGVSEVCLKHNTPQAAPNPAVCAIKEGSQTEVHAVVVFAAWKSPQHTLISLDVVPSTNTDDNTNNPDTNNPDTDAPVVPPTPPTPLGGAHEITDISADEHATKAMQFALAHAESASNRLENLVFVRLIRATVQVVSGKLYTFEISMAPSANCLKSMAAGEKPPVCVADKSRRFTIKVTVLEKPWIASAPYTVSSYEEIATPIACSAIYSGFTLEGDKCVAQRTVACSNPYPYRSSDECQEALAKKKQQGKERFLKSVVFFF